VLHLEHPPPPLRRWIIPGTPSYVGTFPLSRAYLDCIAKFKNEALKGNAQILRGVRDIHTIRTTLLAAMFSAVALPQNVSVPPVQRHVQGQTITSNELPAADLTFGKDFRYVGGQVVNLYGNADAEQHLFVKAAASGPVQSFYWVQFEHFLPSNKCTYDYKSDRTTDLGGLQFIYDVKSFLGYDAALQSDPRSDGAAVTSLLAQHSLAFPKRAARVRMFHLRYSFGRCCSGIRKDSSRPRPRRPEHPQALSSFVSVAQTSVCVPTRFRTRPTNTVLTYWNFRVFWQRFSINDHEFGATVGGSFSCRGIISETVPP
jgi:hypothetical protein